MNDIAEAEKKPEKSSEDKDELEYMRKLAYSIEHDTMPPER